MNNNHSFDIQEISPPENPQHRKSLKKSDIKSLKQKLEAQNRQIIEIEHKQFGIKSEDQKNQDIHEQVMQIETFQKNLSATNFRKLVEHLIQENEKVLKSSAYQIPLQQEEEKKHESSGESLDQSSSDANSQLYRSFDQIKGISPNHRQSIKKCNSELKLHQDQDIIEPSNASRSDKPEINFSQQFSMHKCIDSEEFRSQQSKDLHKLGDYFFNDEELIPESLQNESILNPQNEVFINPQLQNEAFIEHGFINAQNEVSFSLVEESKILDDPQNFCNYSLMESSILIESQIAQSEQIDIQNELETPIGNVSDDEEEKQPLENKFGKSLESENYLENLTQFFKDVKKMGQPISFKNVKERKPAMLIFGEIGNGKSTTANYIMYHLEKRKGREIGDRCFECRQSTTAVTRQIQSQEFEDMIIIDTPGYNDPNFQSRSDNHISHDIVKYVSEKQLLAKDKQNSGALSGMLQCLMIPKSGRISHSAIKSMSRILLSFTLSYESRQTLLEAPLIQVLFTNFSKIQKKTVKRNLSSFQKSQSFPNDQITFTQLIKSYREQLIFQILEDQHSNNVAKVTELVEDFLPNENFYTFKLDENHDESREIMEEEEIIRIVEDNLANGGHIGEGLLMPVIQENDIMVKESIDNLIKMSIKQIEAFKQIDVNHESEAMIKQYHLVTKIQKDFNQSIKKQPHVIQKIPINGIEFISEAIKKFNFQNTQILQKEIETFNINQSQHLKNELSFMNKKQQEDIQKLNGQLQEARRAEYNLLKTIQDQKNKIKQMNKF